MSDDSPSNSIDPSTSSNWITQNEARDILGVSLGMFEYWIRQGQIITGRWVDKPGGETGRLRVYSRDEIEKLAQDIQKRRQQREADELPEGYVDRTEAAKMFGIARATWKGWVKQKKVPAGTIIKDARGSSRSVYTLDELERIRKILATPDPTRPYRDPENPNDYVLPAGTIRRDDAWGMFGVTKVTWERWEREGIITCGEIISVAKGGRLKIYPLAQLKEILAKHGRFSPPYPDPDHPEIIRVPLSGRSIQRHEAIIDAADLHLIESGTCTLCAGSEQGSAGECTDPHVTFNKTGGSSTPLRRVIMGVIGRELQVGHINGDPLDCRRENLIVRTAAERSYTQTKRLIVGGQRTSSRFKGVYWAKRANKWCAGITRDGIHRYLGLYPDELAAAEAYDEAARELFGEHAWLNFPNGIDAWLAQESTDQQTPTREAA